MKCNVRCLFESCRNPVVYFTNYTKYHRICLEHSSLCFQQSNSNGYAKIICGVCSNEVKFLKSFRDNLVIPDDERVRATSERCSVGKCKRKISLHRCPDHKACRDHQHHSTKEYCKNCYCNICHKIGAYIFDYSFNYCDSEECKKYKKCFEKLCPVYGDYNRLNSENSWCESHLYCNNHYSSDEKCRCAYAEKSAWLSDEFSDLTLRFSNDEIIQINDSLFSTMSQNICSELKDGIRLTIYQGNYNGNEVCAKVYSQEGEKEIDFQKVYNEIRVYQKLSSLSNDTNCFLKYYGTYLTYNSVYMAMEWVPYNLMAVIFNLKEQNYTFIEVEFIKIALKLLASFTLMKENGILHGNIKPHNMLVDSNWNIKIVDFNFSLIKSQEIINSQTQLKQIQGAEGYYAPELKKIINTAEFDQEKVDVYTLGLVFYQLLTFKNVQYLKHNEVIMDIEDYPGFSAEIKEFLKMVLRKKPSQRPNFAEALRFLKNVPTAVSS